MKKICLLSLLINLFLASTAQPPGKLMCSPVSFTCWSDFDHMNEYFDLDFEISFWEDLSNSAYVYLQEYPSGESKIIPMKREAEMQDNNRIILNADVSKMNAPDIKLFYISIPTEKVSVGCSAHDAEITITTFDGLEFDSMTFYIEEPVRPVDLPIDSWDKLSIKSQKYINSFNSMVDYVNSIQSPLYNGYYKVK